MIEKKKPSEFLSEYDSHGVYDALAVEIAYEQQVGEPSPWKGTGMTPAQVAEAIAARGVGGYVKEDAPSLLISGHEMSWTVAAKHGVSDQVSAMGRGTAHRQAIAALQKIGK